MNLVVGGPAGASVPRELTAACNTGSLLGGFPEAVLQLFCELFSVSHRLC